MNLRPSILALAALAALPPLQGEGTDIAEEAFRICDLDGNRWISLSEAEATLGMNRTEFSTFDTNNDGRIVLGEFQANAEAVVGRLGFAPSEELRDVNPSADVPLNSNEDIMRELLGLYDTDGSRGMSTGELDRMLRDYDAQIDPSQLMAQADRDESGELELGELNPLVSLVSDSAYDDDYGDSGSFLPPPATIRFLGSETMPLPDEVGHFLRLDYDLDGSVSLEDLRALSEGGRIPVRPGAVISAVDRDGDGELSSEEFWFSMGRR